MQVLPDVFLLKYSKKSQKKSFESGQALLIVLLTMSLALTLILSVVAKSVTDISVSTYHEESVRAFDAAEAGIEQAVVGGLSATSVIDSASGTGYDVTIRHNVPTLNGRSPEFLYPSQLNAGESATFWFVSHDQDGNLSCDIDDGGCYTTSGGASGIFRLCYGNKPTSGAGSYSTLGIPVPAIEVLLFYDWNTAGMVGNAVSLGDYTHVKVARATFDTEASRRLTSHFGNFNLTPGICQVETKNLSYRIGVSGGGLAMSNGAPFFLPVNNCDTRAGCLLMMKVRMLYVSSPDEVGISGHTDTFLPPQGIKIESTGNSGEVVRKVQLLRGFPEPPFVFDSVIFSKGDLVK